MFLGTETQSLVLVEQPFTLFDLLQPEVSPSIPNQHSGLNTVQRLLQINTLDEST